VRRAPKVLASFFLLLFLAAAPAGASTVSDFQARLAQTQWNIQALEGMVKAQRASNRAVATPEAIDSFLQLLAENVATLNAYAAAKVTDEQGRVIAEGLRSTATQLRDLGALTSHRGLSAAASEVSRLETSCRLVLPDTN
jgi:hypothetical protein